MDRDNIIAKLQAHRVELERMGILSASLFGSMARGDNTPESDVDIAVKLDPKRRPEGIHYFGYLGDLQRHLQDVLDKEIDVVVEPAQKARLQNEINEDRVLVF